MKKAHKQRLVFITLIIFLSIYTLLKIPINLGLDLQGGTQLVLEARDTEDVTVDADAIDGVIAVIQNRVDALGVSEPIIRKKGTTQILVELAGIKNPERAIKLIGDTALLEFVEGSWAPSNVKNLSKEKLNLLLGDNAYLSSIKNHDSEGSLISEQPIILKNTALTGADLKIATPGTNEFGEPVVFIEFNKEGAEKFKNVTSRHIGKPLAILLDGTIISAPNINEAIPGGKAQISGNFSITEMKDLVIKLKAGALPVPVDIVSNKIIGPTLGKDSIEKSKKAGIIGLILICLLSIIYYKIPGIIASLALILFLGLSLTCLKLFGATLTLPGIAGLILTTGMAVDANIIIFERIKEERALDTPLNTAIEKGFKRAFLTILDANITTLIAAAVLFFLGTGSIKGFAVTLSIGIIVSMFSAIFITKLFINLTSSISSPKEGILFKG